MNRRVLATAATVAFVALVVASNLLTARFGLVWGFVAAGTFTAGLVLAVRDAVRETAGRAWVFVCIGVGAGVSAVMTYAAGSFPGGPSPLRLAAASAAAFGLSEVADHFVYEPLRVSGKRRAFAVSNVVGSVVDSFLFLWLAGFALWPAVAGQVAVKWVLAAVVPLVLWRPARAGWRWARGSLLRHPVGS